MQTVALAADEFLTLTGTVLKGALRRPLLGPACPACTPRGRLWHAAARPSSMLP